MTDTPATSGTRTELTLGLTSRELCMLHGAMRETQEALDDWDFETRMGCTIAEFRTLYKRIAALMLNRTEA